MKKVLAINGSTRKQSTNHALIEAIAQFSTKSFEVERYNGLTQLPHFNPDDDHENIHHAVLDFRSRVAQADGVLICTPEYAAGVPGTLKNALDWCVSTTVFSKKPVALITASSMGERGHKSLLETLRIIECYIPDEMQLLIPFAKSKITSTGITDSSTLASVIELIQSLTDAMNV